MKLKLKEMNTDIIEFEGFKLKVKDFRFKSRDEMNKFFNEALIESPFKFVRLQDQMFIEKMHVVFSWLMISRILAFGLFVPAIIGLLLNAPQWFGISMVFASIFFFLRSKWLSKVLDNVATGRIFFNEMAENTDSLEEVRQELINEQKASAA
jgi:hypothetical protein